MLSRMTIAVSLSVSASVALAAGPGQHYGQPIPTNPHQGVIHSGYSNQPTVPAHTLHANASYAGQVWVEPVYDIIEKQVVIPAEFKTIQKRVWIEPVFKIRTRRVWVPRRNKGLQLQVNAGPVNLGLNLGGKKRHGSFKLIREKVLVQPGHFKLINERVLVRPQQIKIVKEQVLIEPGYYAEPTPQCSTNTQTTTVQNNLIQDSVVYGDVVQTNGSLVGVGQHGLH